MLNLRHFRKKLARKDRSLIMFWLRNRTDSARLEFPDLRAGRLGLALFYPCGG
ncbi:hypothetical protein CHELA1G11_12127 [Hyphomicrobiales bacterium]|nr:hypothetical protein CHELA1G11_12127 [Hyphomicrobiales bacterium]CAH1663121.1 hypothetical protein CHELA1G2_12187 [Hyphomicrobiales bacterium]